MYEIFVKLLQEKNVTAYKISKETGITHSTFSDWKNGRSVPKMDKLKKIADYFSVELNYLLGISSNRHLKDETAKNETQNFKNDILEKSSCILAINNEKLYLALEDIDDLSTEDIDRITDYINLLKNQHRK